MTELGKTRQIVATVCIALVHLVATVALLFASFRGKRFDRGIPRSLIEEVQGGILYVFMFPLINNPFTHLLPNLPGALGYLMFFLNSLIWGIAIVWIVRRWRRASTSD